MNKAIVTGATGFLGTALCRELSRRDARVIAVVRNESDAAHIDTLPGLRVVRCDMADYAQLPDMIAERDVDVFFHLAWRGGAGPDRGDARVQLANVSASCCAVDVCAAMGIKRYIFASSVMEVEIASFMRTEGTPPKSAIYPSAKIAANYMARATAASCGVDHISAMISNVYGPGETSPRLINSSLRRIARGERCSFSPGDQMYDFIYIEDAVRAIIGIAERGRANRTYYIGSGRPRPLKEFLVEMGEAVGRPDLIGLGDMPFSGVEVDHSEIDVGAVKRDAGIEPEVSFRDGIERTYGAIRDGI